MARRGPTSQSKPTGRKNQEVVDAAEAAGARTPQQVLEFAAKEAASGRASWNQQCQRFVRTAIGAGGGARSASIAWSEADYKHAGDRNPPAGALVYWTGGSKGFGHAAISDGKGNIYTTHVGGRVRLMPLSSLDGGKLRYEGWSEDTNNVRVPGLKAGTAMTAAPARGDTSTSTNTTTGPSSSVRFDVGPEATKLDEKELASRYGVQAAFYNSDPSLKKLIEQATKEQWSEQRFQAELTNTPWYQKHTASQRTWQALVTSDPREANLRVNQAQDQVTTAAQGLGIDMDPDDARALGHTAAVNGWDAAKIEQTLRASDGFRGQNAATRAWNTIVTTDPREANRQVNVRQDSVTTMARSMGIKLPPEDARRLAHNAAVNGWDDAKIEQQLRESKGFTQQTAPGRDFNALVMQDPREANRQVNQKQDAVTLLAQQLGVKLDPAAARALAHESLTKGMDEAQVRAAVAKAYKPGGDPSGLAGQTMDQLRRMSQDYVVPLSDATLSKWTGQVLGGQQSVEDFTAYVKKQAAGLFPEMTDELDRGMTVRDYLNPYAETAGRMLDIDPNTVDWADPKWSQAVFSQTPDGKRSVQTLAQWGNTLRKDTRYGFDSSDGAIKQSAELTGAISKTFGGRG